jgi:hypothetical protein
VNSGDSRVLIALQVAELQRLRKEEARRTAEIEEALAAVKRDDTVVEGREQALRAELEEIRQQHADRQVRPRRETSQRRGIP